jgi:ATP-dependent helicase HrpB
LPRSVKSCRPTWPLALELAAWGVDSPGRLRWLDPPPAAAFDQARQLLSAVGALDGAGAVTRHGRRMAELPMHPRLAHMVLAGMDAGAGGAACDLAAILSERDFVPSVSEHRTDPWLRWRSRTIYGAPTVRWRRTGRPAAASFDWRRSASAWACSVRRRADRSRPTARPPIPTALTARAGHRAATLPTAVALFAARTAFHLDYIVATI